jgi:type IV secretory pathway VirD2 relaxase
MSTKTDEELPIRIRPSRPLRSRNGEVSAWSNALTTILRYARGTRHGGRATTSCSKPKVGNQRCAIRVIYSRNSTPRQWRAHGRYIARESATGDHRHAGFDEQGRNVDPASTLDRWQSARDPRIWKLIISPEFGERLDLQQLTRDLTSRMESDLGTKLEWAAVVHLNTQHPHVHVALRGIRQDGTPLDLHRDYIRQGIRTHAEELCTNQLGFRSDLDRLASERGEITARRFTSLDRVISRSSVGEDGTDYVTVRATLRPGVSRDQHVVGRLAVLQSMGLAHPASAGSWKVRQDFEVVLKAMQRAGDRQKMLAAHGAVLSDDRLQIVVLDWRKMRMLEGRVLVHGEDELGSGAGRHYFLLEGTDARVHMIYYTADLENARAQGTLRPNSFVRLRKRFENGRPLLEAESLGNAEAILRDRNHLESTARVFARRGILPAEDGWGGWLGRYQAALARTAADSGHAQTRRRAGDLQR